jgi:hypothetical protein
LFIFIEFEFKSAPNQIRATLNYRSAHLLDGTQLFRCMKVVSFSTCR